MGMEPGAKHSVVSDPNIVPLIDVLLVLIIIFMVITPVMPNGLPVAVPQPAPSTAKPQSDPNTIVIQVLKDGKLMLNQEQTDWSALGPRLSAIFKNRAEKVAFVTGAEEAPFAQVARAIDIVRTAGADHVGLITEKDFGRTAR